MLKINEVFNSIQGEGLYTGYPMTFVRLSGCNLHCSWCDTNYRSCIDSSKHISSKDVLDELVASVHINRPCGFCITGGEPMLQAEEWFYLINKASLFDVFVELETNASIEIPNDFLDRISSVVYSPKPPSAEVSYVYKLDKLRPIFDQLKLNLYNKKDYDFWVNEFLPVFLEDNKDLNRKNIFVSPIMSKDNKLNPDTFNLAMDLCLKVGIRMSIQVHKLIGVK